jgi:hypothetical protein
MQMFGNRHKGLHLLKIEADIDVHIGINSGE